MKFLGALSEAKAFMAESRGALEQLNTLGRGFGLLGDDSGYDAMGNSTGVTEASTTTPTSVYNPANGTTTTTNADGSVTIVNAQGQDVTANYVSNPGVESPLTMATGSVGDAASNLFNKAANGATTTVSSLTTIALIAAAGFLLMEFNRANGK